LQTILDAFPRKVLAVGKIAPLPPKSPTSRPMLQIQYDVVSQRICLAVNRDVATMRLLINAL